MNIYQTNLKAACKLAVVTQFALSIEEQIRYVLNMVGFNCEGQLLDHIQIKNNVPNRAQRDRELFTALEERVKVAPRGAFVVVERIFQNTSDGSNSHSTYQTIVSDGTGEIANGGRFNSYSETPSIEAILINMVNHEIYHCIQVAKQEQLVIESQQSIREHGLKVGQSFKNVDFPGFPVAFSNVKIQHIDYATGEITLSMTRKNRAKVEKLTLPASQFATYANLSSFAIVPPANQELVLPMYS